MCFSGMRVVARVGLAGCRCAQVGPIGAHHPNVTIQTSFLGARVPAHLVAAWAANLIWTVLGTE